MGPVSSGRKMRRDAGVKNKAVVSVKQEECVFSTLLFFSLEELDCSQENAKGNILVVNMFSLAVHSDIRNSLLQSAADAGYGIQEETF